MKIQLRRSELNKFWFTAVAVVFSLCLFVVLSYTGYTETVNNVIAIASVLISFYLCFVYRYNIGLLIVMLMIFYTNYSVAVGVYLDPSIRPVHLYEQFKSVDTYGIGIMCIYLFVLMLLIFSSQITKNPHIIDRKDECCIEPGESNFFVAFGAMVVYCVMFFLGFDFGLGEGGRALITSIGEYKIIVQIIGMYYSCNKKVYIYVWTILVGLTTILTFVGGNRIDAISNIIALVIFGYSNFINYKRILLFLPVGIILLTGIGYMRTGFSLSSGVLETTVDLLSKDKLTYEGAVFGYLPSLSIVEMEQDIFIKEKIDLLAEHFKNIWLVISTDPVKNNLSNFSRNYYLHYWGFISPTYFYFWFKYIGPVLFALLVNVYIKMYVKSTRKVLVNFSEKLMYILSMYFICNVGRWYCYGPMYLFRGAFVCIIVYAIVYFADNIIRKGKKERS